MNRKALSAVMRRAQITQFAFRRTAYGRELFTVTEVARCLALAPSGKLKKLVLDLVNLGILEETCEVYHGAVKVRYFYRMTKAAYKKHMKHSGQGRHIVINGKVQEIPAL